MRKLLCRFQAMPNIGVLALLMLCGQGPTVASDEPLIKGKTDASKRYLIIHSDDAAMSHSVNRATIDSMENGFVSSCSIMVPCPWFPEFAEWAKQHPEKDFGIHLTLNSEFGSYRWGPVAGRDKVPTLVDEHGYLFKSKDEVIARARPAEVEIELRAQIDRALAAGIRLSHLDTHMGTVVSTADMLDIYVRLGIEYNLPVMIIRNIDPALAAGYPDLVRRNHEYIQQLEMQKLPPIDYLYQFYDGKDHDARQKRYLDTIRDLKPGVTQLIIHCGYDDSELQAITGSHFLRDDDRRIFSDPAVRKQIEAMGVEIIDWTKLREMQKAR
ncbi:MAG: polysaccharide deacetylase family protein [Planctomycetaceae bacterium]